MTTAIKRNIMKEAHKLAKEMVGDYQARLALALRKVWTKVKNNKEENKMNKEKEYNSWYRREKEFDERKYELTKRDREEFEKKGNEEIKKMLEENGFGIKRKDKGDIMTFYEPEDMSKIRIRELASGLILEIEPEFNKELKEKTIAINLNDFVDIRDWARENLEEVSL